LKIEKFNIQACCGGTAIIYKVSPAISKEFQSQLINLGFVESAHFTKAGILYVDNLDFIVSGPFGTNKLQVKCKKKNCEQALNNFEALLLTLE
jgi:hypothetical protein|tara:strand:- start:4352 stop:4630 length:279 start_codon:yes stop_codon:yes gene_type:complete